MALSNNQAEILRFVQANGGKATTTQVLEQFGSNYFCNAETHLGAVVGRMVNAGLLVRERRGVYALGSGKKPQAAPTPASTGGVMSLFD